LVLIPIYLINMNTKLSMKEDTITIKQRINQYILQQTYAEKSKIQDDSLIFKEGYFDSMGFIMLITFIEEEFEIRVGDADLVEENFESINSIASYILRKKNIQ
jgi:acyl carrier protein